MRVTIKRDLGATQSVEFEHFSNLLMLFYHLKSQEGSFGFGAGCRSGVCGACAVRVNGKEQLACTTTPQDGDHIEPLANHRVIKDLKVEKELSNQTIKRAKATLKSARCSYADTAAISKPTECILCHACYSACAVLEVDAAFLGPFALMRNHRYVADQREGETMELLEAVQQKGIWDCTQCGACNEVCPQQIDIKGDILRLRSKSIQAGFSDPSFSAMSFGSFDGTPDFSGGF